jgi:hypothetical protein
MLKVIKMACSIYKKDTFKGAFHNNILGTNLGTNLGTRLIFLYAIVSIWQRNKIMDKT